MSRGHPEGGPERPDYRHAYPVFILVASVIVVALSARAWLVPDSFGRQGFYRATAIGEEQAKPTHYVGRAVCGECHEDEVAIHAKDVHASVECETCHGAGWKHAADGEAPMRRADQRDDCLVCHRQLDARPGSFPQVVWTNHYQFVGVRDLSIACVRCHSGHEPLFLDRDFRKARLHPLIHDCGDCHVGHPDTYAQMPPTHPKIFQCESCHPAMAASFATKPHHKVACTTCHLFIKENAYSGRIVRNADPRFCLLCHQQADFKTEGGPPKIAWPAHVEDVSNDPPNPKRSCMECHEENVHDLYPKEVPHVL